MPRTGRVLGDLVVLEVGARDEPAVRARSTRRSRARGRRGRTRRRPRARSARASSASSGCAKWSPATSIGPAGANTRALRPAREDRREQVVAVRLLRRQREALAREADARLEHALRAAACRSARGCAARRARSRARRTTAGRRGRSGSSRRTARRPARDGPRSRPCRRCRAPTAKKSKQWSSPPGMCTVANPAPPSPVSVGSHGARGERGRDRGVDRVAAVGEDLRPRTRAGLVTRRDCSHLLHAGIYPSVRRSSRPVRRDRCSSHQDDVRHRPESLPENGFDRTMRIRS